MLKAVVLMISIFFFTSTSSFAGFENLKPSPWTKDQTSYIETTVGKLGFGTLNTITGWSSIFFDTYRYDNKFQGLIKGSWRFITNTVGGALHMATFPFPFDIPLPDGGVSFE